MNFYEQLRWVVVLAAIPAVAFPVVYWRVAPWRDTAMGRHTMAFSAIIGALLAEFVLVLFVPGYYGMETVQNILYTGLVVMLWWRLWLLIAVQRHPERYSAGRRTGTN